MLAETAIAYGRDEYADPCCFGSCTQSNCCRDFQTVHLTDLKTHSRAGDVLLFDSKCVGLDHCVRLCDILAGSMYC